MTPIPTPTLCGAKTKYGKGPPCERAPMHGQRRCYVHGGAAPQNLAKAAERLALIKAHRYLQQLGAEDIPHRNSGEALQSLGNDASLLVDLLRGVVANLRSVDVDGGAGVGVQLRGELQAYLAAVDRATNVHSKILSLGLEERRVLVEEQQQQLMEYALLAGLHSLALPEPDRITATKAMITYLKKNDTPTARQKQLPRG
jgi:hypothetical protein